MPAVSSAAPSTALSHPSFIGHGTPGLSSTSLLTIGSRDLTRYHHLRFGHRSQVLTRVFQIFDPVQTFLETPELLQYVRHAQATGRPPPSHYSFRSSDGTRLGSIHKYGTTLFDNLLTALSKCRHLESFTWSAQADRLTTQPHEDPMAHSVADQSLRGVTKVLAELPITELTIRSYVGLSEEAWSELIKISGLKRLSLWCMEGQPRVLQGWSETLGSTLTHVELGVSLVFITPFISLFDLFWTEVHRSSTDRPTFGSLPSRSAQKPQPPWRAKHSHSTHLDIAATPTVPRHRLQPLNRKGSTTRAAPDFETPGAYSPNDHRRRSSKRQRMDQKSCSISVSGIIQAPRLFRSRRQRLTETVHSGYGPTSRAAVETISRHRSLVVLA